LARIKDPAFDPERSVVLGAAAPELAASTAPSENSSTTNSVSIGTAGINESEFSTVNSQAGVLVVSQIFYPGWIAIVDGKEKPVVRADYALTAVPLDAGAHSIRPVFRPASVRIGMTISIATLALIAGLLAFSYRRHYAEA
jgi:uncharacterized membrane protein YfhO